MPIKEIKCFECSDKTKHDDRKNAQKHEYGLDVLEKLIAGNFQNSGELKRIALYMANNFQEFSQIFTNIRRVDCK